MHPRSQYSIPRQSLFLFTTNFLLMVIPVILSMNRCVLVRSLSQVQSTRRTNAWIPFLHRSNVVIQAASQKSNTIMMLPFRTLVTNEGISTQLQSEQITRTMVHRMRISDLKDELERRGLIISGIEKLKRPDLVRMLLSEISKSHTEQPVNVVAPTVDLDTSSYTNSTNDNENIGAGSLFRSFSEEATTALPSASTNYGVSYKNVGVWSVEKYPLEELQIDPNNTYSIAAAGVTVFGKSGKGIGIVMRECSSNTIVWQAQKFYPGFRSIFESNYCAVILALRFALQMFKLVNVQLHVPNFILLNQIMGNLRVTKPTLQLLLGQVTHLLKQHTTDGLVFQLADEENRLIAAALAKDALRKKNSFNLGEENDNHRTADPMLDFEYVADKNRGEGWRLPKPLEDKPYVLKFQEKLKPEEVVIDPSLTYKLRFDGGSRGNPGVAGAGMVLYDDQDREIWRGVKYLGRTMSNNLAEYSALHLGLSYALSIGIERIHCEGDSQLVVKQLNGIYKVKSDNLRNLFNETQILINKFKSCQVHHIRREHNSRADELANQAMSTKSDHGLDKQMTG